MAFTLRSYQQKAVESVLAEWAKGHRSTLLVMATGTGKTVVFAEIVRRWTAANPGRRVLVMAHRRVLVEQAKAKLADMRNVDVTTVQAANLQAPKADPAKYGLIVIDEAHHTLAKSYRNVIRHYADAKVLGVTATPERADGSDMGEVFDSVAYSYDMADAINDGYLSQVRVCSAPLAVDLSGVHTRQGDYDTAELASAVEPLLNSAANWIKSIAPNRHVVVFLPLVDTAKKMAKICRAHGIAAEEIDGQSSDKDAVLKRFESGETRVLCNAALLTEGWDAPICDCVMVLRPTQSRALYVQMVGRGTRLHEGKADVLVPDVLALNARHDVMRPADVLIKDHDRAVEVMEAATEKPQTVAQLEAERDYQAEREASIIAAMNGVHRGTTESAKRRPKAGKGGLARRAAVMTGRIVVNVTKFAFAMVAAFVGGMFGFEVKDPEFI